MPKTFTPLPPITYLDMDGVCVAWSEAVFQLYGVPMPTGPMPYEFWELLGVTADEAWDRINAMGSDWWAALPPCPWFKDLYRGLQAIGPKVVFLTSPCTHGHSAAGKIRWIRKHVGTHCRDYVITSRKHLLARPGAILVDDCDEKLQKFATHGGAAVVFPRQWNTGGFHEPTMIVKHTVARVREAFLRDWGHL